MNNNQQGGRKTKKSKSATLTEEQRLAHARAAVTNDLGNAPVPDADATNLITFNNKDSETYYIKEVDLLKEIKGIGRGYHDSHYKFDDESRKLAERLVKSIHKREAQMTENKKKKRHLGLTKTKKAKRSTDKSNNQSGGAKDKDKGSDTDTDTDTDVKISELGEPNLLGEKVVTSSRQLQWGLGVEHEMQIFHAGKPTGGVEGFDRANIIFDSQESTCFITGDKEKQGACRKLAPGGSSYYYPATKKLKKLVFRPSDKLSTEEHDFLKALDWELTGRQVSGCKNSRVVIPRVPVLMPELVTSNFRNRSINSIANETITQEQIYLDAQMKNPFTREKVRIYGPLVTHVCASLDNIKVPRRPTIFHPEYKLENGTWSDYVGSYHVTITLPHTKDIDTKEFIKMHQDCANAIQWLEPLLITAFFGPDMAAVGAGPKPGIEGSFRVMAVGWGNLAGSDVRKFGTSGIGRGANHKTKWRKGLKLRGTQRIEECVKTAPAQYKKAVDINTSDFRTFNFERDQKKCERENTPYDCPKVDGGLMEPPFGMEIRIFDHFPSEYILDLLKIIILVAANSERHPPTGYVYNNKAWKECIQGIMREGWNYKVKDDYMQELKKQLGLNLNGKDTDGKDIDGGHSLLARDVLIRVIAELHHLVGDSTLASILDETPEVAPRIPDYNRMCWEISFRQKGYQSMLVGKLRRVLGKRSGKLSLADFRSAVFKKEDKYPDVNMVLNSKSFGHQIEDIAYALEKSKYVSIERGSTGSIKNISLKVGSSKSGKK